MNTTSETARRSGDPYKVNSLMLSPGVDPVIGSVRWDPPRSLWNGIMLIAALTLAPVTMSWDTVLVFLTLTAATLCAGHSVGFHRRLIHRSFQCPKWVERVLVWMGTAYGMGGPLWTIRVHDTRDWAQRQPHCHDFFAHRLALLAFLIDGGRSFVYRGAAFALSWAAALPI